MRKTFTAAVLSACVFGFCAADRAARAQEDVVLAQGDPPLTRSMVSKTIILLEWALDIRLTDEQKVKITREVVRHWQTNDREEMQSTVEIANTVDGLRRASPEDREKAKGVLQAGILKGLRADQSDEISRVVLRAYEEAHPAGSQPARPSPVSPPPGASNTRRVGADGFSGIYVGVYNPPPGAAINSVQVEFVTFLPGGQVYWRLPPEGLLHFDPGIAQRAHPDDWGTYRVVGSEIQVTLGNNLRRVFVREGGKLKLQGYEGQYRAAQNYTYSPLATGDGLRLDGTYRRWAEAPGITFSEEGGFRDEGFARNFGTIERPDGSLSEGDGRGGTGTYLIEQNTLELRYADGRVKRFAFTALPENLARRPVRSFRVNFEILSLH